jgi:hypothetical protein
VQIYSDVAFRLPGKLVPAAQKITPEPQIVIAIAAGLNMGSVPHTLVHAQGERP